LSFIAYDVEGNVFSKWSILFDRTRKSESNSEDINTIQLLYCQNIHE